MSYTLLPYDQWINPVRLFDIRKVTLKSPSLTGLLGGPRAQGREAPIEISDNI